MATERHTEVLRGLATGEIAARDPVVARLRASDPEFARRMDELLAVRALLDRDAADERAILGAGRLELVGGRATRRPPWGRRAFAAAAILATALALWRLLQPPKEGLEDGPLLGANQVQVRELTPRGDGQSFASFRFSAELPPDARCAIRIWDAGSTEGAAPLLEDSFTGLEWAPTDTERSSLPAVIRWDVRIFDVEGTRLGSGRVDRAAR